MRLKIAEADRGCSAKSKPGCMIGGAGNAGEISFPGRSARYRSSASNISFLLGPNKALTR